MYIGFTDVQSDHNEGEGDTIDVPDDFDVDPEATEPEVSQPTNLPKEIAESDTQSLTEIEPPVEEFMEEPEPPSVPEEALTGAEDTKSEETEEEVQVKDGVQKAEINLIEEVTEEVTEFPSNQKDVVHSEESDTECKDMRKEEQSADAPPTENSCEDPGGLSEEKKAEEERRFSNDDYVDAVETQSEIREGVQERTNNEEETSEKTKEEITDQEKTDVGKEGAESDPETADKQPQEEVTEEDSENSQIIEDKPMEKSEEKILDNDDNENHVESTNTTDNRGDSGSPV